MNAKEKIRIKMTVSAAFSQKSIQTYGRLRRQVWFERNEEQKFKIERVYISNKNLDIGRGCKN